MNNDVRARGSRDDDRREHANQRKDDKRNQDPIVLQPVQVLRANAFPDLVAEPRLALPIFAHETVSILLFHISGDA